jgi:hypothetical protein
MNRARMFESRVGRAGVVAAALALTAAVGYASIPDASGVIHACHSTRDGVLRVIDAPSQTCSRNEIALSWNQSGPSGPAGPAGTSPVLGHCREVQGPPWGPTYTPTACTVTFTLTASATVLVDFGAFLDTPDGFAWLTPQVDADPAMDGDSAANYGGHAAVAGMVPKTLGAGSHTITLNVRKDTSIAGGASLLWMKVTRI